MQRKISYYESISFLKSFKKKKKKNKMLKKVTFLKDIRYKLSRVL